MVYSEHERDDPQGPLKAPPANTTVTENGKPVSATLLSRRTVTTGAGAVALFEGFKHIMEVLGWITDIKDLPPEPKSLDEQVRDALEIVFPFLTKKPGQICYHPNGDNRLLDGIGYGDSTISDHLRLHGLPLVCIAEPPTFAQPRVTGDDLSVFSLMTLRQGHQLDAVLHGRAFDESQMRVSQPMFSRSFANSSGPHVVIGSPTGNRIGAYLRGKWRRIELGRERELVHEGIGGMRLPFEFSLDADEDPLIVRPDGSYAWGIKHRNSAGEETNCYRPAKKGSEQQNHDYFLVSVIPNHYQSDMEQKDPVVLLEGGSSIGTSAFEELWRVQGDSSLVELAQKHVGPSRSKYWQALFQVTNTGFRQNILSKPEEYAKDIRLVDFAPVRPNFTRLRRHRQLALDVVRDAAKALARGPMSL